MCLARVRSYPKYGRHHCPGVPLYIPIGLIHALEIQTVVMKVLAIAQFVLPMWCYDTY